MSDPDLATRRKLDEANALIELAMERSLFWTYRDGVGVAYSKANGYWEPFVAEKLVNGGYLRKLLRFGKPYIVLYQDEWRQLHRDNGPACIHYYTDEDGKLIGNGLLKKESFYDHGKLLRVREYSMEGVLQSETVY